MPQSAACDWGVELEGAREAALAAGAYLASSPPEGYGVVLATDRDVKLEADRHAEAIIMEHLTPSGYPILAEESGEHGEVDGDAPLWIVDPLDGTVNFSRHIPICCVSIGLYAAGRPVLGVINDFNRGELFTAIAGQQASCNGKPISVSKVTNTKDAVLTTGFTAYRDYSSEALQAYHNRLSGFKKVRMIGSAALSMAYVAIGRFDAYVEDDVKLWDIAGGAAIVEAAGGHLAVAEAQSGAWARHIRAASSASILKAIS